jgi:hypothetical protein
MYLLYICGKFISLRHIAVGNQLDMFGMALACSPQPMIAKLI